MTAVTGAGQAMARDLLATRASVGLARTSVSAFLRSRGLGRYEERALLIVSELMTNAVAISAVTDVVRVYVACRSGRLWIGVCDGAPEREPVVRRAVSTVEEIDRAD